MAYNQNYYIVYKNKNGDPEIISSYHDLEEVKEHAKRITSELNISCLIVKPITKVIPHTEWRVEDL